MQKAYAAAERVLICGSQTMSSEREIIALYRDCTAMMVPSGARIMLHQGTEVTITQSLGNSYTVNVFGNLARIDGKDADALGKTVHHPIEDLPEDCSLEDKIWAQLKTVFVPEIPVNIVDLGLVYGCKIEVLPENNEENPNKAMLNNHYRVNISMTLTAPGCGMGPVIAEDAKQKVLIIPEVKEAEVEITFDPPWDRSMMSDLAKLELGIF
jgi:probable FeS assembly SUF system protein SufT